MEAITVNGTANEDLSIEITTLGCPLGKIILRTDV